MKNNTIWHLAHSAFALKMDDKFLIFDYHLAETQRKGQGLDQGYIDPEEIKDEEVYVFSSHVHADHFNRDIFSWKEKINNIHYILSFDIKDSIQGAICAEPGGSYQLDGLKIKAYSSTDEGVSFSVFINDKHIYFAGDNAYWNWDEDKSEKWYIDEVLAEIDKQPVDIAFQICDPRLKGKDEGGIFILAQALKPKLLVPIHSFGDYSINKFAEKELRTLGLKGKFWCVLERGEKYHF